jgi:hypothetical protein
MRFVMLCHVVVYLHVEFPGDLSGLQECWVSARASVL